MTHHVQFEVELVSEQEGLVFARLIAGADFTLTDTSTLAGRPLSPWLSCPLAASPGEPRWDVFAFRLRDGEDVRAFAVGDVVTLAQ